MTQEPTIDDVARKSGVSRATASRALNNREGVRDDVRERVKLIAESLNYRPNKSARNLAGGRASVLGLVLGRNNLRDAPYEATLLQEVARAAENHDEGLMVLLESENPSKAVRKLIGDGLIDGVIISAVAVGSGWVEELLDARMPTVLLGSHPTRTDVSVIDVENIESAAAVVDHLIVTAGDRIAMLTGPEMRTDAEMRIQGYVLAHERRSIPIDENLIIGGDHLRATAYRLADQLLDQRPDAIFAGNDESAMGIYYRASERGITIPDELSLAGFDGHTATAVVGPKITSVEQPFAEMADRAVETLIAHLASPSEPRSQVIAPPIFYGETTRRP